MDVDVGSEFLLVDWCFFWWDQIRVNHRSYWIVDEKERLQPSLQSFQHQSLQLCAFIFSSAVWVFSHFLVWTQKWATKIDTFSKVWHEHKPIPKASLLAGGPTCAQDRSSGGGEARPKDRGKKPWIPPWRPQTLCPMKPPEKVVIFRVVKSDQIPIGPSPPIFCFCIQVVWQVQLQERIVEHPQVHQVEAWLHQTIEGRCRPTLTFQPPRRRSWKCPRRWSKRWTDMCRRSKCKR